MGCDIHTHIEYKKNINDTEKWICADYFKLNTLYKVLEDEKKYEKVDFCEDRDYGLFATLANVRNYGKTEYIDKPRGLPKDVSKEVKQDYKEWRYDAHSCSYFTLDELIEFYNKNKKLKRSGMISPEDAKNLDNKNILPNEWCQYTNIEGWEYREWEEENKSLENLINKIKERTINDYFIYEWEWDENEIPQRAKKVRFIFWFDN